MHRYLTTAVLALSSLAASQTPTHISPILALGGVNPLGNHPHSYYPFAYPSSTYQQVHSLSSFHNTNPAPFTRLRLRMAQGAANTPGTSIDVEIHMAASPHGAGSASDLFANNVVQGTEVNVFARKMVMLPQVPDHSWAVAPFAFDVPFPFTGTHISWKAIVRGNTGFVPYALDHWYSTGTSVAFGSGCLRSSHRQLTTVLAPGSVGSYVGSSGVQKHLPAVLTIGSSNTSFAGLNLPFDMGPVGAPGCSVYNDWAYTAASMGQSGFIYDVIFKVPYPEDPSLAGSLHFSQIFYLDPTANALGVYSTNGVANRLGSSIGITTIFAANEPTARIGSRSPQFGLAIALD